MFCAQLWLKVEPWEISYVRPVCHVYFCEAQWALGFLPSYTCKTRILPYLIMAGSPAHHDALLEAQLYLESPPPSVLSFLGETPPKRHQILRLQKNFNYEVIRTRLILPLIMRVNQIHSDQLCSNLGDLPIAIPGNQASISSIVDILLETNLNNPSQGLIGSKHIWNIVSNLSAIKAFPVFQVYRIYRPVFPDVFIASSGMVDFTQPVVLGLGGQEVEVGGVCEVGSDFVMMQVRELGVIGVPLVRQMMILESFTSVHLSFLQRFIGNSSSAFFNQLSTFTRLSIYPILISWTLQQRSVLSGGKGQSLVEMEDLLISQSRGHRSFHLGGSGRLS